MVLRRNVFNIVLSNLSFWSNHGILVLGVEVIMEIKLNKIYIR